jgi:ribosomal protein S18 acetylase RimI-like enzyme
MFSFNKITKKSYKKFSQELKNLYLDTFTRGLSAQHITSDEAEAYLDALFEEGYAIVGFSENQVVATLIVTPPSFDVDRPKSLAEQYNDSDSLYIAEVLVDENYRGQGLGKKLFEEFETKLDSKIKQVLLRVWDKNEVAVQLYKKNGFKQCGSIVQKKLKPVSKLPFEMEKIYMLKSY